MVTMRSKTYRYPFPPGTTCPWKLTVPHWIELAYKSRFRVKKSPRPNSIRLTMVNGRSPRPLAEGDMPLIFLCCNERRFLPSFFEHYRLMGVTRFICVDDRSTDGAREYLLEQADTDVFESDVRYADAAHGGTWREILFHLYGYDRWYLNVDADEYLVFEGLGRDPIRVFVDRLFDAGIRRLPAPMIELYPITPLEEAVFDGQDERMPWEVAGHFDGDGYTISPRNMGLYFTGGVRTRVFGANGRLMKYPLIYWNHRCSLRSSIHRPLPGILNFAPVMGCTLHFKIFSDFRESTRTAAAKGQHHNDSAYYRELQQRLDSASEIRFEYEHSLPYRGPQDLIERGFMLPLTS